MTEQTCLNCQWFCAKPQWDREAVAALGFYGECRRLSKRNWTDTWASYWCGEWEKRERGPAIDPTPDDIKNRGS